MLLLMCRYLKPDRVTLDFDGIVADIRAAPTGSVFLMHACSHNPTGAQLLVVVLCCISCRSHRSYRQYVMLSKYVSEQYHALKALAQPQAWHEGDASASTEQGEAFDRM